MRATANRHRRDVEYKVGDLVLLKLQLYRQHSVARPLSQKLARRYYGPFSITERIGAVAYRLALPEGSKIHDVFHVGLLRPFVEGSSPVAAVFPSDFARGKVISRPTKMVGRRRVMRDGVAVEEVLVQWDDDAGSVPSWEPLEVISRRFPTLTLEDKSVVNGGGVDTVPVSSTPEKVTQREKRGEGMSYDTNEREQGMHGEGEKTARPKRSIRPPRRFDDFLPK